MLHGLWSPGAGLLVWRDDESDRLPDSPLARAVANGKFRHRATVLQPSSETEQIRAQAFTPLATAEVLLGTDWDEGLASDLIYLRHVARGLDRWVRAGRVVPEVYRAEGEWWTRWRLVGGERQRAWLAELAAAMPPVQRQLGPASQILADFVAELTDPIARDLIGLDDHGSHPLIESLIGGDPLIRGTQALARSFDTWRTSLTVDEPELVLRLLEPDDDEADLRDDVLWRLEVCLRPEGEAPQPIPVRNADPVLLRIAVRKLGEAIAAYPRLRDVPSDPHSLDLLLPTSVVTDLVVHGALELRANGIGLLLPRSWGSIAAPSLRLKVESPTVVAANTSVVGMNELVTYNWQLAVGYTVLTADEMARLIHAKSDLVRLRGHWVQADHAALAKAAKFVAAHTGEGTLNDLIGQFGAADPPPVPVMEVTATGWAQTLLDVDRKPAEVAVPAGLNAELRPYQRRGLDWLSFMSTLGIGGVLADDMGLGKTVQLLALLEHERAAHPTLLVCPMSVVGNWQREASRFTPDLRVQVHHGSGRLAGEELAQAVASADLVITTYALVAKDFEQLKELTWDRVVLDEAQHVKNAGTAQSKAVRSVPARHRIALTGTPVENRLEELRAILDFANPKMLGSPQSFRAKFAIPIEREHDDNAAARLRTITSPFVLRRVKTDPTVISDLPDKFEMTMRANLTEEQAALYRAIVDEMLKQIDKSEGMSRKGAVLAALTRLKQVCNHPAHFLGDGSNVLRRGKHRSGKLGLVEDIVESVLADDEKALLFTQFREFGEMVTPYLRDRFDVDVPFLHGGVSKRGRDSMVTKFQGEDGPPLMLLSLKAGGTGLNLTAANHVVHLDRWWNPAVENQATDRAFRIGQRKDVQVRKLICVGTVEERIDEMLASKQELADLAVGSGESWVTELSTDQLRDLLSLGADAVGE
ncbi:DEAD/DEAH box helicase [Antrihabitans cavernicola]|uniref:DEAD/DEAH box helicase n=1 Tax=Antrihabitans cavernicola TaxID=2495913 RepID=A0A5A7S8D3_9NOCA|nr:DEAD/DEAH box helicase [Spelaeibacter cavernicola]KAA0022418.1 DEAD/DEAH box helicase [Spelaeibacter cavernicola]